MEPRKGFNRSSHGCNPPQADKPVATLHSNQPRAAGLNSPAFGVWFGPFGAVILGDRVPWVYSPVANCTHGY